MAEEDAARAQAHATAAAEAGTEAAARGRRQPAGGAAQLLKHHELIRSREAKVSSQSGGVVLFKAGAVCRRADHRALRWDRHTG